MIIVNASCRNSTVPPWYYVGDESHIDTTVNKKKTRYSTLRLGHIPVESNFMKRNVTNFPCAPFFCGNLSSLVLSTLNRLGVYV